MLIDRLKEMQVGRERIEQVTAIGGLVVGRARDWAKAAGSWGWAAGQERFPRVFDPEGPLPIGKLAERIKQAQSLDRAEVTRLVREELPTRVRSTVVAAWEQAKGRFAR